jgi:hypothetical protein
MRQTAEQRHLMLHAANTPPVGMRSFYSCIEGGTGQAKLLGNGVLPRNMMGEMASCL